jgi:hypothetical protein
MYLGAKLLCKILANWAGGCYSNGRASANKFQGPEFKPKYTDIHTKSSILDLAAK